MTDGGRDGESAFYVLTLRDGVSEVSESEVESPDARVTGDTAAWIEAFAPGRKRAELRIDGLRIEGNATLAEALLEQLIPAGDGDSEHAVDHQPADQQSAVA